MYNTTYINDLIRDGLYAQISYRNLHPPVYVTNKSTGETISIPYLSLTNKYKDYLRPITLRITLEEVEAIKYKYQPKLLSLDLYGTTELWASLLEINNMISVIEFKSESLIVYDPAKIKAMINEILIMEGILK